MNTTTDNTQNDDMSTLSTCMTSVLKDGYTESFKVKNNKLHAPSCDREYAPEEVTIDNFYRFEGASDPADNSVLYAISTNDGVKGMLIDAYGTYAEEQTNKFIKAIEEVHKDSPNSVNGQ